MFSLNPPSSFLTVKIMLNYSSRHVCLCKIYTRKLSQSCFYNFLYRTNQPVQPLPPLKPNFRFAEEEEDQEQLNKVRVRVGGQDESDESSEDDVGIRVPDN